MTRGVKLFWARSFTIRKELMLSPWLEQPYAVVVLIQGLGSLETDTHT